MVEFGEVHVFVGPDFVITVRHSEAPDLGAACGAGWRANRDLLRRGPEAVLYAILDQRRRRLRTRSSPASGNDIDEIEIEVFSGDPQVSRRIYELSREVIEFQRATRPLIDMLERAQRRLREVRDRRRAAGATSATSRTT